MDLSLGPIVLDMNFGMAPDSELSGVPYELYKVRSMEPEEDP
jgi:hypothetical protein